MNKHSLCLLFVLFPVLAGLPLSLNAAVGVETNNRGWSCGPLVMTLKTRWLDFKRHMLPAKGEIDRPDNEHFVCLTRDAIRDATPRNVMTSAAVRCYSAPFSSGLGICCDEALSACAQLSPALFPELQQNRNEEVYQPPESIWVRPPGENDQWQSN